MIQPQEERKSQRGKYTHRACEECKRRKVKCEGDRPCSRCKARNLQCVVKPVSFRIHKRHEPKTHLSCPNDSISAETPSITGPQVLDFSHKDVNFLTPVSFDANCPGDLSTPDVSATVPPPSGSEDVDGEETSSHQNHIRDGDLVAMSLERPSIHTEQTLNSLELDSIPLNSCSNVNLCSVLMSHGVFPDKWGCDKLLSSYFRTIHILDPFLHAPSVWRMYNKLWSRVYRSKTNNGEQESPDEQTLLGIAFLCMAITSCEMVPRISNDTHPASDTTSWRLYNVAAELLHPLLEASYNFTITLPNLQALTLLVLYYIRSGSRVRAERILSHAIYGAHTAGLHQESTYNSINTLEKELFRRVWWELYIIDRHLALETIRPVVIRDADVNVNLPSDLTDRWLGNHGQSGSFGKGQRTAVEAEVSAKQESTNIPYLKAMIAYSKVVGHVCQGISTLKTSKNDPEITRGYLEALVEESSIRLPSDLMYSPSKSVEEPFYGLKDVQITQSMLLYTQYLLLKIHIQRSFLSIASGPRRWLSNRLACITHGAAIVDVFEKSPTPYGLPLLHLLLTVTTILFDIALESPQLKEYVRMPMTIAVKRLFVYCHLIRSSGRTVQAVFKFHEALQSGLLNRTYPRSLGQYPYSQPHLPTKTGPPSSQVSPQLPIIPHHDQHSHIQEAVVDMHERRVDSSASTMAGGDFPDLPAWTHTASSYCSGSPQEILHSNLSANRPYLREISLNIDSDIPWLFSSLLPED